MITISYLYFVNRLDRLRGLVLHSRLLRRRYCSLTLLLTCMGLAAAGPLTVQAGQRHEQYAVGHILVKLRAGETETQLVAVAARHGAKAHHLINSIRVTQVDVAPGTEDATVQAMALDPNVEFAEVDRRVDLQSISANDTYYNSEWHLAKIGAPTAWGIAKGDGVVVAVIDSGVDGTHPDLTGQLVPGWNLYDNNSNTSDVYGHGTEVAGVIAAASNNSLGVTSVAWNAKIMPVRVSLPDGSAYISTIASGITYAADHGANIANASFATLTGSPTIQSAANYMRSKGGLVVVAADNSGTLDSTPNTTAVISVSATDSSDALASWSSYGPYVDVSAPGVNIWTTTMGGGYAAVSGTSFSSPMTAAVLALMKSANPALSNVQLESILENTAVDLGTPGYDQYFGYGRIDAAAAVAAAASFGAPAPDTQAPTASITAPTAGATVSSTVIVSVNAADNVGVSRVDLYAGTALIGTSTAAPYSIAWNTTGVADGATTLVAHAYDQAGNKGTSVSVTVMVSNALTSSSSPGTNPKISDTSSGNGSTSSNVGGGGGGGGGGSSDLLSMFALLAARRLVRTENRS